MLGVVISTEALGTIVMALGGLGMAVSLLPIRMSTDRRGITLALGGFVFSIGLLAYAEAVAPTGITTESYVLFAVLALFMMTMIGASMTAKLESARRDLEAMDVDNPYRASIIRLLGSYLDLDRDQPPKDRTR